MSHQFSSITEVFDYLNALASAPSLQKLLDKPKEKKLDTITTLMQLCNNPHKDIKLVHITGSKGKSTVAHTAGALLEKKGFTTGVFTSPHIHAYNERILINSKPISDEALLQAFVFLHTQLHQYQEKEPQFTPTFFEFFTALSFVAFSMAQCQWAVIEVGIGGRYDTTNFIHPQICIFTEIELEHTKILGSSVTEIASDKAGIIKPNAFVWIGKQPHKEALQVVKNTAQEKGNEYYCVQDIYTIRHININLSQNNKTTATMSLNNNAKQIQVESPSIGEALLENQILTYCAVEKYFNVHKDIFSSLTKIVLPSNISLPARCEVLYPKIAGQPLLFLDGAHTQHSIHHACSCISQLFSSSVLIFSMAADKNKDLICNALFQYKHLFKHIIITRAGSFKPSHPQAIAQTLKKLNIQTNVCDTEKEALKLAYALCKQDNIPLCVLGSFYLCAECRHLYLNL